MAKGNGNTRNVGPGSAAGSRASTSAVDEHAAWRVAEGSENYTYEPDKVKFSVTNNDIGGDLSTSELRYRSDYEFSRVERNTSDGKYHINDNEYIYNQPQTFNQAIQEAVRFAKERYQNNEKWRDSMLLVRNYDDDKAPSAWVYAELVANNKVKISITRFKPE